ncbi:lytic transglycosylase domain-containing protein [Altererythrobacter lutimaris]|uniref:lytic transglycosylase domain-containing protein n=1 Tax=Altererythrobacter lutimaris TaxID=2743979 RepID=UPI0038B855B5
MLEIDASGARWIAGGPKIADRPFGPITVSVEAGRLANGASIPAEYIETVATLSERYDISPALIEALVWQESRWRENAVSPKGARGLAQLMPATARYLGVDPDDPIQNLEGGARYLREQLDRFDGNLEWALAAYNAGPGRVERAQGIPRIRETRIYVASIMARLALTRNQGTAKERALAVYDYSGNGEI